MTSINWIIGYRIFSYSVSVFLILILSSFFCLSQHIIFTVCLNREMLQLHTVFVTRENINKFTHQLQREGKGDGI